MNYVLEVPTSQLEKEPQVTRSDEYHSQCQITSNESNLRYSCNAGNDKKEVRGKKAFHWALGHKCLNATFNNREKKACIFLLNLTIITTHNVFDTQIFARLNIEKT